MKFSIYQESRQGPRKANQDRVAYSYSRDSLCMVIADGMGGHLHGEVAAQIATQFIVEAFQRQAQPRLNEPFKFLLDTIMHAHLAIIDYANVRGLLETPRTTCVACVVQDGLAYWAHVGDSRLYLIREGRIEGQTRDHSRVQMLVDSGRIREEAVAVHPDRNKIFNCLGQMAPPKIELSRATALRHRDTILMCSDGLWGPLSGRIICEALLLDEIMGAIPKLLDMAAARAGKEGDNLSALAITWAEEQPVAEDSKWISTVTMNDTDHRSTVKPFGKTETQEPVSGYLSDDEIERAIDEIRIAIRKQTK
ncbi:MAG TPA: protein phosphatase 2C domain-containing protein [Burkholderiales bacterium]|nr:protein phosphatase 2C domain-containing protein [Burkholderiales bacterium]